MNSSNLSLSREGCKYTFGVKTMWKNGMDLAQQFLMY